VEENGLLRRITQQTQALVYGRKKNLVEVILGQLMLSPDVAQLLNETGNALIKRL
jgi:hypothetical protein